MAWLSSDCRRLSVADVLSGP